MLIHKKNTHTHTTHARGHTTHTALPFN